MKTKITLCLQFVISVIILVGLTVNWSDEISKVVGIIFVICLQILCISYSNSGKTFLKHIRGIYWRTKLKGTAKKLCVGEKVQFQNPENIEMGDDCNVLQNVVFAPLVQYNEKQYKSKIKIGNRVNFGAFDRIASMNEVIIEDDVLFAAFVHITDHSHGYQDVGVPIVKQDVFSKGPIHIKKGAWLAFGCHILSGVTIGEYAVVAANAVVTKDVPPYTIVAGNPARIIKRYNIQDKK